MRTSIQAQPTIFLSLATLEIHIQCLWVQISFCRHKDSVGLGFLHVQIDSDGGMLCYD